MDEKETKKIATTKELLCQLVDKKAWDQILVVGEYLASLDPDNIFAYQMLGYAAINTQDLDGADKYFRMAMERGDSDTMVYLQMARVQALRDDLSGKMFWLKKAIEQDPDNTIALFNVARTHQMLKENDLAEQIFQQIVEKHPEDVESWRALADLHLVMGKQETAEQDLRSAIAADDKNSALYVKLAWILKNQERYDDALAQYFAALDLDPANPVRYYDIGDTFLALADYDKAITFLTRSAELDPDNPLYHYNLGLAFFSTGRYDECEAANRAALRHDSQMMNARTNLGISVTTNLGLAYLNQGKLSDAEQCFRQNLQLTASSHFNLGLALHWQGKYEEALKQFLNATDLVPDDAPYWDMAGNAWLELGDLEHAKSAFERAIGLDPSLASAQYDLGVVFSRMSGKETEAMKQFRQAIALDKKFPLPYYTIACLHALDGKKAEALDYLDKAVDLGFSERQHADEDHDLDSLRAEPEFQKIIEKMASMKPRAEPPAETPAGTEPVPDEKPGREQKKTLGSGNVNTSINDNWERYIW